MTWLTFIAQMMPSLLEFAKLLFARHHGDVAAAKAELRKIPDEWSTLASERARIDAELKALKEQGK